MRVCDWISDVWSSDLSALKRDLDEPETTADFVEVGQSLERLRLLLVRTVADIRAVGPKTWNGWKAQLLRDLYYRAEEVLSGGLVSEGRESRVAAALTALKAELGDWSDADFEAHMQRGTPAYWLSFDTETHARHARLVRGAEQAGDPLSIDIRVDAWRAVTEITVRSEEHTSELQSLMRISYAVFCLKKKNTMTTLINIHSFYTYYYYNITTSDHVK